MLFNFSGILHYSIVDIGYKLVVEVDQQLADYYFKLIPKYKNVNRQKYPAHISLVRYETPVNLNKWGCDEGKSVVFCYDNEIKNGKVYYWLNVFSRQLEGIRMDLGLPIHSQYTLPPEGFTKCFHMTIANTKG